MGRSAQIAFFLTAAVYPFQDEKNGRKAEKHQNEDYLNLFYL
jgi:hypothetical protein